MPVGWPMLQIDRQDPGVTPDKCSTFSSLVCILMEKASLDLNHT